MSTNFRSISNPCGCGCGQTTKYRFVRGHYQRTVVRVRGYRQTTCPVRGVVEEHVLVAEAAIGKMLPFGAEVHHVDKNRQNNAHSNLVICQDRRYHRLLHARARVVSAGGNPNTESLCRVCERAKPFESFAVCKRNGATGRQGICRSCSKVYDANRFLRAKSEELQMARHQQ